MQLSLGEICVFANSSPRKRNFIEGERVLNAGHIIYCWKKSVTDLFALVAYCMQTSGLKNNPHEIKGEIALNGKILRMECSCKAGLSEQCKHIFAVLIYCSRNDLKNLLIASCTYTKCLWNEPRKEALEKYEAAPLDQHECFAEKFKAASSIDVTEEQIRAIRELVAQELPDSAVALHMKGRHAPVENLNNNQVFDNNLHIEVIFNYGSSNCMNVLDDVAVRPLHNAAKLLWAV